MKILVAEDQPDTCSTLARCLAGWGYEVVRAGDGREAWQALQAADAPMLALIDWVLPGMDGLEVCRHVRAADRLERPYIILLSGRTSRDAIVAGLDGGADAYLPKPVDLDELRARIQAGERLVGWQSRLSARVRQLEEAAGCGR
jgi:DNA-binding response OmpR family regulator